ncbi:cation:proton antiporter [Nonomuraea sp. NPDC050786]|uniref:cation:proton antiporter n=1 Tax=Nonomuraea sp. NPDC050786 TaxID=3154840 RepID=UPI0033F9D04B
MGTLLATLLVAVAVVIVVLAARLVARLTRQPAVVVEIAFCLASGWLLLPRLAELGPRPDWGLLGQAGHLGLALFLVGTAHGMRAGLDRRLVRTVTFLSAGSAAVPLAAGGLVAWWLIAAGDPALRGGAPAVAFTLMVAVALTVTAVPVLAGILRDRRMDHTVDGRLALLSASCIDVLTWVLLAVAVGMASGGGPAAALTVLAAGAVAALLLRRVVPRSLAGRFPRAVPVVVGAAAWAAATATGRFGLTEVFGAVLVGLSLPAEERPGPWTRVAEVLGRTGRTMLPVLFVTTGVALTSGPEAVLPWQAALVVTAVAVAAKVGGSYAGARLGGRSPASGARIAVLMNTRGLTEIVILQAGYGAGLLSPGLYLAFLCMALITTGLSGLMLNAADRYVPIAKDDPMAANITLAARW